MRKYIITFILIVVGITISFAQNDSLALKKLQSEVSQLNIQLEKLKREQSIIESLSRNINSLNTKVEVLASKNDTLYRESEELNNQLEKTKLNIDSLKRQIKNNSQSISKTEKEFGLKLESSETQSKEQFSSLRASLSSKTLWGIVGFLIALILLAAVYFLLYRKQEANKTDVETRIQETKKSLEEESLKLDTKLMEVLNKQLKIEQVKPEPTDGEKDHSLVLKVADEVTRILMNLEVMDKSIRGYKHLKKYSSSILDNLKAYGYEIPVLLGETYDSRMNMVATRELDSSVKKGQEIIKRVIKPQVNYQGKMIQAAKVIVAYNE